MYNVVTLLIFLSAVSCFHVRNRVIFDRGLHRDQTFINEPSLKKVAYSNFVNGYDHELDSHFANGFGPEMMQLIVQAASLIAKPLKVNGEDGYVNEIVNSSAFIQRRKFISDFFFIMIIESK